MLRPEGSHRSPSPVAPEPRNARADWIRLGWLAAVTAVVALLVQGPIARDTSHLGRLLLAGAGAGLVLARIGVERLTMGARDRWRQAVRAALVVLTTVGWFNYYQFDREVFAGIDDHTDITYYYLNSKYLDELGFYGFYAALLVADAETNDHHTHSVTRYRDLRDDTVKPVAVALAHGESLRDTRFTEARWEAFCADADWFLARIPNQVARKDFYVDHGYNPPPTWSIVGGALASVPVAYLKWIASVDTALVALMFVGVGRAFGAEVALWAMLYFVCTFSGRWPILGQALLRFDWLAALVGGVAALRVGRHGAAGGLLTYAALNRVFPAIFLGGWLWTLLDDLRARRGVSAPHLRFAGAGLLVAALLTGGAWTRYGREIFEESAHNLSMHNRSFSSHRIGLGTLAVWRGETTGAQIERTGGMAAREVKVQAMQPALRIAGVAAIALVAAAALRSRRPAWETTAWLILPLFCLTNPQVNYYNLRLLPVVWHAAHIAVPGDPSPGVDRLFHRFGLIALFLVEVCAQGAKVTGWTRFGVNGLTSAALGVYLLALTAWLILDLSRGWRPAARAFPSAP